MWNLVIQRLSSASKPENVIGVTPANCWKVLTLFVLMNSLFWGRYLIHRLWFVKYFLMSLGCLEITHWFFAVGNHTTKNILKSWNVRPSRVLSKHKCPLNAGPCRYGVAIFFNQSNRHIPQISSCHLAIFGIAFVFCRSRLKSRSIKIYNQTPRGTCNNICTTTYCIVLYAHGCLKPSLAICSANLRSPFLYQQFCFYFKGMFLNGTYDTYNYVLLRLKLLITACFNTLYPHFQQSARIKGGSDPSPFLHLSSEKVPHSHGMVWVFSWWIKSKSLEDTLWSSMYAWILQSMTFVIQAS